MTSPVLIPSTAPRWALVMASTKIPFDEKFTGPDGFDDWQRAVNALAEKLAQENPGVIADRPRLTRPSAEGSKETGETPLVARRGPAGRPVAPPQ